jgi:hypothetical protein
MATTAAARSATSATAHAARLDFVGQRDKPILPPRKHAYGASAPGQRFRDLPANAARRAGDDGNFFGECHS